jgi:drug/metabolite transporter (DMT)-like permease
MLAVAIRLMSARIRGSMAERPPLGRLRQAQYWRNPARCHRMTVSGSTMINLLWGVVMGGLAMFTMAAGIVAAKPVLERSDFWWATTVRLLGAAPLLVVHGLMRKHRQATRDCFRWGPHWRYVLPGAVLGTYVALGLWILGFKYALASTAGVLNQTSTFFVLILATLWLKEPLTKRKAGAVILGFAGASLATFQP